MSVFLYAPKYPSYNPSLHVNDTWGPPVVPYLSFLRFVPNLHWPAAAVGIESSGASRRTGEASESSTRPGDLDQARRYASFTPGQHVGEWARPQCACEWARPEAEARELRPSAQAGELGLGWACELHNQRACGVLGPGVGAWAPRRGLTGWLELGIAADVVAGVMAGVSELGLTRCAHRSSKLPTQIPHSRSMRQRSIACARMRWGEVWGLGGGRGLRRIVELNTRDRFCPMKKTEQQGATKKTGNFGVYENIVTCFWV
jgi:hypothetical protein